MRFFVAASGWKIAAVGLGFALLVLWVRESAEASPPWIPAPEEMEAIQIPPGAHLELNRKLPVPAGGKQVEVRAEVETEAVLWGELFGQMRCQFDFAEPQTEHSLVRGIRFEVIAVKTGPTGYHNPRVRFRLKNVSRRNAIAWMECEGVNTFNPIPSVAQLAPFFSVWLPRPRQ